MDELEETRVKDDGPGKADPSGWVTFRHRHGDVEVSFDEDGSVTVEWNEQADDMWGSATRRAHFPVEEFEQIVSERAAYLDRNRDV